MYLPGNLDDDARAELLCYLLVSQLLARRRTGNWLSSNRLIERARRWLGLNDGYSGWFDRARLCALSEVLAADLEPQISIVASNRLAALFYENQRLNYRRPLTRFLHNICAERLRKTPPYGEPPT
ncbi:hypothetical protein LJ656_33585 [Paraburkholderia sp. MMS20-SJTR3]|uniref:Uncharacterized protein n=1 Tax=Paraburkholderia sejongensis TaxID=2886946 RepID=A0ABS8K5P4_9BURK|nr:hypothetical protein [Paraburkholderia sp. MMS20-SJTR3]MCC8397489.1 hypothetical protein [Paraburkholderia sp. MMS20-SJTR3]